MDKNTIDFQRYFNLGEPIYICIENENGMGEIGYLISDNGNNTFDVVVEYPFGDCKAIVKKKDNSAWDVFEFVNQSM